MSISNFTDFEINKQFRTDEAFVKLTYIMMREFHQPYSEILNMPIPLIKRLMKELDKEFKEKEKAYKKKR
jgi:hypothetical protein